MNPLARLIHSRKEELGLSWYDIADRGGFSSHSIVYALAKKKEHRAPPRLETLQRLAKALDLPLDNVKHAAIEASGFEVKKIEVGLEDADRIRIVVAAMGDMDERDKDKLVALAEAFAAEAQGHHQKRQEG